MTTRQREWQKKMKDAGRCVLCGKKRPKKLKIFCRSCSDKWNKRRKLQRKRKSLESLKAEIKELEQK